MNGRKPDLVCIGAQKSATSWFHRVMEDRSDTWCPPLKEIHFFDFKFCPENRNWVKANLARGLERAEERHRKQTGDKVDAAYMAYLAEMATAPLFNGTWYKRIFAGAPAGAFAFEVTPEYSGLPEDGVDFVARFLPQAKFVYILRDPVDRAISQLRMNLSRRKHIPQAPQGWRRVADEQVIVDRGDYASYVPRWDARFGPDRLLYLPYGDVARDPKGVMRAVERFAGLGRQNPPSLKRVVFATEKIEVPEDVRTHFEEKFAPQRAFLAERFGADFAARTR